MRLSVMSSAKSWLTASARIALPWRKLSNGWCVSTAETLAQYMINSDSTYLKGNASGFPLVTRLLASATCHWQESAPTVFRCPSGTRGLSIVTLSIIVGTRTETSPQPASVLSGSGVTFTLAGTGEVITHYDFSTENHVVAPLISSEKSNRGP